VKKLVYLEIEDTISTADLLMSGDKASSGVRLTNRSMGATTPAPPPMGGTSRTGIPEDKSWSRLEGEPTADSGWSGRSTMGRRAS
jgi:hypothetical protein